MATSFDIVVASHLRWNFVWQRPQQLISRLAKTHRILFVEEPILVDPDNVEIGPSLEEVAPNITVMAPRVPNTSPDGAYLWSDRLAIGRQVRYAMRMLELTGPRYGSIRRCPSFCCRSSNRAWSSMT